MNISARLANPLPLNGTDTRMHTPGKWRVGGILLYCERVADHQSFRVRRGGRAVDCAGLENRKAERPREFESHPLRQPSPGAKRTAAAATSERTNAGLFCESHAVAPRLRLGRPINFRLAIGDFRLVAEKNA